MKRGKYMGRRLWCVGLLCLFCSMTVMMSIDAQTTKDYRRLRNHFYNRQFEETVRFAEELLESHPSNLGIVNYVIESLKYLKEYERALAFIERKRGDFSAIEMDIWRTDVLLLQGKMSEKESYDLMERVYQNSKRNLGLSLRLIRLYRDYGYVDLAIRLLEELSFMYPSNWSLLHEKANTLFRAGNFEETAKQLISLLSVEKSNQAGFVRNFLNRNRDSTLFAYMYSELDLFIEQDNLPDQLRVNGMEIYLWILMEEKYYKRAVFIAKRGERKNEKNHYLYQLVDKLIAVHEYELAESCLNFYVQNENHSLYTDARLALANLWLKQGNYYRDYSIVFSDEWQRILNKAVNEIETLVKLVSEEKSIDLYAQLIDIYLSVRYDTLKVRHHAIKLKDNEKPTIEATYWYALGRLEMANGNYPLARVYFTKSLKKAGKTQQAEKTRYYLGLNDFFGEDFEFAVIQLDIFNRQLESRYTNDAIQLRSWIVASSLVDTTQEIISLVASLYKQWNEYHFNETTKQQIDSLSQLDLPNELMTDLYILFAHRVPYKDHVWIYQKLEQLISKSGKNERLMWQRALMAEYFVLFHSFYDFQDKIELPVNKMPVVFNLYKEILEEFPNGFYSYYVRQRLNNISMTQSIHN